MLHNAPIVEQHALATARIAACTASPPHIHNIPFNSPQWFSSQPENSDQASAHIATCTDSMPTVIFKSPHASPHAARPCTNRHMHCRRTRHMTAAKQTHIFKSPHAPVHTQREGERVLHTGLPYVVCGLAFTAFPLLAGRSPLAGFACLTVGVVRGS